MSYSALTDAIEYDISTFGKDGHASFIDILAYLAAKNGGNFSSYNKKKLTSVVEKLSLGNGVTIDSLASEMKYYTYFKEAYSALLGGFLGEYYTTDESGNVIKEYGVTVRSPFARGYYYSHFDDFGVARSYGYKREHLGHDLMGSVGTPIIAVESGYVEAVGWNQYGGWRIGIRSFDGKRYYYYAHLRKNHPYNDIYEGKIINAGEVIGYLGMTGYSRKENVNNITTPHLHYGLQLIFDKSQKDGINQIWIDMYVITNFLQNYKSAVTYDENAKEYYAVSPVVCVNTPD